MWAAMPIMSVNPASWRLVRRNYDSPYEVESGKDGFSAELVYTRIPRSQEAPSLGIRLDEFASNGDVGIVGIEGLVEGGNGERASEPLQPGDVLVAAREVDNNDSEVLLEGLTFDDAVDRLSTLDTSKDVILQVKRLVRIPRATVRVVYPEVDEQEDSLVTLYSGMSLRQAMLQQGVKLNDPLARRFDAGGLGDCGGEGCCCTCAVDVQKGMGVFNPQKTQEAQMLKKYPRWRLACKAFINDLQEDEEVTIKVMPRNFAGFYGEEECDIDGVPLARDRTGKL